MNKSLNSDQYSIEVCRCNWWTAYSEIESQNFSGLKTKILCDRCYGLLGWLNESTQSTQSMKIIPLKRSWSYQECLAMK